MKSHHKCVVIAFAWVAVAAVGLGGGEKASVDAFLTSIVAVVCTFLILVDNGP